MTVTKISDPCIRCGRERIIKKAWKEKIQTFYGATVLEHTLMICPDKKCQKIVDGKNREDKKKTDSFKKSAKKTPPSTFMSEKERLLDIKIARFAKKSSSSNNA